MKAARGNMLGAGTSNNKVKYSRLAADDDGYIDLQVRVLLVCKPDGLHRLPVSACRKNKSA